MGWDVDHDAEGVTLRYQGAELRLSRQAARCLAVQLAGNADASQEAYRAEHMRRRGVDPESVSPLDPRASE